MKDDEKEFLRLCIEKCGYNKTGVVPARPREIINSDLTDINHKRAWYLLEKWSDKGWYNWGVTLDLGWFEPEYEEVITASLV